MVNGDGKKKLMKLLLILTNIKMGTLRMKVWVLINNFLHTNLINLNIFLLIKRCALVVFLFLAKSFEKIDRIC